MNVYPFLAHNIRRPDMAPIVVHDAAYDMALDSEWSNPYGVRRVDSPLIEETATPETTETRRPGRPRKV